MKRIILFLMLSLFIFTLAACTYTDNSKLIVDYDEEKRLLSITNISESTDYEKLRVTVILQSGDNFNKEITCDIGTLKSGEIYTSDLSYISEEINIDNVYIKSYEYYQNDAVVIFLLVILTILLIIRIVLAIIDA